MGQNRTLSAAERAAWRSFLVAHDRLTARIDAELLRECDMTLAEYEVLASLVDARGHQRRMNELAELARLSPSGLTRRFDALARRGWVERERCGEDRRGVLARLTDEGVKRAKAAAPVHDRAVRRHCFEVLDPASTTALGELMADLAAANDPLERAATA
jgi:DNA-binding MarR family transcriptional regulator